MRCPGATVPFRSLSVKAESVNRIVHPKRTMSPCLAATVLSLSSSP